MSTYLLDREAVERAEEGAAGTSYTGRSKGSCLKQAYNLEIGNSRIAAEPVLLGFRVICGNSKPAVLQIELSDVIPGRLKKPVERLQKRETKATLLVFGTRL